MTLWDKGSLGKEEKIMPGTLIVFKEEAIECLGIIRKGVRVEELVKRLRMARKRADNTFSLKDIGTSEKELRVRLKKLHASEYGKYSKAAESATDKETKRKLRYRANYHANRI